MFLNKKPEIVSYSVSSFLEFFLMRKYPEIDKYTAQYTNSPERTEQAFDTFFDIVSGKESNVIYSVFNYLEVKENSFQRIVKQSKNKETKDFLKNMATFTYYLQDKLSSNQTLFPTITKGNSKYDLLLQHGYDIHKKEDMSELLYYVWSYSFPFKVYEK